MDNYFEATRNHIAVVPRQSHAVNMSGMLREDTCNHHFSGVDEDAGMKEMSSQKLRKVSISNWVEYGERWSTTRRVCFASNFRNPQNLYFQISSLLCSATPSSHPIHHPRSPSTTQRLDEPSAIDSPILIIPGGSPTSTPHPSPLSLLPTTPLSPPPPPPQLSIKKIDTMAIKVFVSHLGSPGPHRYRLVQDRLCIIRTCKVSRSTGAETWIPASARRG